MMMERKEIPWIHVVRVLACFMVVCLHVSTATDAYPMSHMDMVFKRIIYIATRPCVPLFFMITGYLLLPYKDGGNIMVFYRKRIPHVWFPLFSWGVIYAVLPYLLKMTDFQFMLKEVMLSPIKQPYHIGGILWYLYILIGIYLFIPFLSERIYSNILYLRTYLILWIASASITMVKTYVPNCFGENHWVHNFDMFLYFSGYLGFLLFGFAIRHHGEQLYGYRFARLGGVNIP